MLTTTTSLLLLVHKPGSTVSPSPLGPCWLGPSSSCYSPGPVLPESVSSGDPAHPQGPWQKQNFSHIFLETFDSYVL